MIAVILNAGLGSRLLPLTKDIPKCLLQINGKSILEYQIDILRKNGISEIIVVVGYKKEKILNILDNDITIIENPIYFKTNSSYSLWLTRNIVSGKKFLYLNGDLICHESVISKLLKSNNKCSIIIEKNIAYVEDSFKAIIKRNKILRMEKGIPVTNPIFEVPGPALFSKQASAILFNSLHALIERGERNQWVYSVMSNIAKELDLTGITISNIPWIEIDEKNDLKKARRIFQNSPEMITR